MLRRSPGSASTAGDRVPRRAVEAEAIPEHLGHDRTKQTSTQEALGRLLTRLADLPEVGKRIVTAAPDVSVSTNLGGWINKAGVFASAGSADLATSGPRLLRWEPKPSGQHIELGISEMNLFMLLAMFGLSHELCGQLLFPIGTVYDPFVCRGLDAFIYGVYSHRKFIIAGTPSRASRSRRRAARTSRRSRRPSAWSCRTARLRAGLRPGAGVDRCSKALRQCCDREHGLSSYLRLSTKPIEQALLEPASDRLGQDELRRQVLPGGYRLIDAPPRRADADPARHRPDRHQRHDGPGSDRGGPPAARRGRGRQCAEPDLGATAL